MRGVKPLFIQMPFEVDIGNVVQVARAEACKVFGSNKIVILDIIKWYPHGWIVICQDKNRVVQNPGSKEGKAKA